MHADGMFCLSSACEQARDEARRKASDIDHQKAAARQAAAMAGGGSKFSSYGSENPSSGGGNSYGGSSGGGSSGYDRAAESSPAPEASPKKTPTVA